MSTQAITNAFKTNLIRNSIDILSDKLLYLFYARPVAFSGAVPDVDDTVLTENEIKNNIMALKKIQGTDFAIGINKVEWTSGTVYSQYDSETDMSGLSFYVITSENKVFKCIDNAGGAASTEEPVEQVDKLDDDYRWKYMFRIPSGFKRKFDYTNYLPIYEDELQINSAIPGTLDRIDITAGGTGYAVSYDGSALSYIPLYLEGDGDEVATGTVNITTSTNVISSISLTSAGSGYRVANSRVVPVKLRQKSAERAYEFSVGTDYPYAYALAQIGPNGSITNIELISGGDGYDNGEAEVVQSSAIAYGILNAGVIESIEIEYEGRNFSYATAVPVIGSGSLAVLSTSLSPYSGHGADPANELKANHLLLNIKVIHDEDNDFTVDNDIRRIGLIRDVQEFDAAGNIISALSDTLSAKETLNLDAPLTVVGDSAIFGGSSGAKALVIDSPASQVRVIRAQGESNKLGFTIGETIHSAGDSAVLESIDKQEYVPYSGTILYINNLNAITRSDDQLESINFALTF
jgi:hypothetical protein